MSELRRLHLGAAPTGPSVLAKLQAALQRRWHEKARPEADGCTSPPAASFGRAHALPYSPTWVPISSVFAKR